MTQNIKENGYAVPTDTLKRVKRDKILRQLNDSDIVGKAGLFEKFKFKGREYDFSSPEIIPLHDIEVKQNVLSLHGIVKFAEQPRVVTEIEIPLLGMDFVSVIHKEEGLESFVFRFSNFPFQHNDIYRVTIESSRPTNRVDFQI